MNSPEIQSRLTLPPVPSDLAARPVAGWVEPVIIDSYLPEVPDRFPAFLEARVYQGSSGRVFPLPFHERISQQKKPRQWQAVHLENRWLRLLILPELGGRIHVAYDKVGDYDIFYRNNVIKPALVGLAGPWISGGVEFNWPQHHRPTTFLPTDFTIEEEEDGAVTVWCSDHDPFARMKGMHGIRLRPDSSRIEARVRLFNRSETTQTFLWWANVAAAVSDHYQSFFPEDVAFVADHAKRAVVTFPEATMPYYGVDYQARVTAENPSAARLDWYRNIPVPTSYMVTDTKDAFFGGYDHDREAGFVHWADRSISPGKKQWTWGNAPFGRAWDSHLTDSDGPYVELMAGVYTDNQPDFAYLAPGETKAFSQYWYPIRQIGPATQASRELAVSLTVDATVTIGLHAAEFLPQSRVMLETTSGRVLLDQVVDLSPDAPRVFTVSNADNLSSDALRVVVSQSATGRCLLKSDPSPITGTVPDAAVEPPRPGEVTSIDELVHIATYLDQYRHATRSAVPYWSEVLRRDPEESRATAALGAHAYHDGQYDEARRLLEIAVTRRTAWASTPASGGAHYWLGLTLLRLGKTVEACDALARASWDGAYAVPARYLLAREYVKDGDDVRAIDELESIVSTDSNHLQARDLLALVLERSGRATDAENVLSETLRRDPLDAWARHIAGQTGSADATIMLDVALEYSASGFARQALAALDEAERLVPSQPTGQVNVGPLLGYHRAAIMERLGDHEAAAQSAARAAVLPFRNTLPSRLDDIDAILIARRLDTSDALAAELLGCWYYDRHRYEEAIALWRVALDHATSPQLLSLLHRNLGLAAYNNLRDSALAQEHYALALAEEPTDARLWYEADQLAARIGITIQERLAQLTHRRDIVRQRDDLTVAFAHLLTESGCAQEAWEMLDGRQFQPWEGGEGRVLDAWDHTCFALARSALEEGDPARALEVLQGTLQPPRNLGEARHPLANVSEHHLWLGDAWAAAGDEARASEHWRIAASSISDFAKMATAPFSPRTVFAIVALHRLGKDKEAAQLTASLAAWTDTFASTEAKIDYFAASLPTMLLFIDGPEVDRDREVAIIRSQLRQLASGRFERAHSFSRRR